MIIGLDSVTTNSLTTAIDEVVIETPFIGGTGDDLFQQHTHDGTNLVYTARYSHGQLTQAIDQWVQVVATTGTSASTSLTYTDTTANVVTVHASTGDDFAYATNNLVFDTGGWPTRVGVTITTSGASTWGTNPLASRLEKKEVGGFTIWVPREPTEEEKAAEALRIAEYERVRAIELAEQKVADEKAESLLRKILTPKQRLELDQHGHFHVWAKDGFKYRINRQGGHNVSRVCPETGKTIAQYCIVPKIFVPSSDRLLAQKLLLEADPERFISLSNVYVQKS